MAVATTAVPVVFSIGEAVKWSGVTIIKLLEGFDLMVIVDDDVIRELTAF